MIWTAYANLFAQDGYKSDYNYCDYYGFGAAYHCGYLQQVQVDGLVG